ncbi:MAG: hypothetical protein ACRDOH_09240 [Streptosporangiaceae bacterium]
MRVPDSQHRDIGNRIRAAAARLLAGDIPDGGHCDLTTLAKSAGVSRATLYRSYPGLRQQFTDDLAALRATGQRPDPRDAQITRLKADVAHLSKRLAAETETVTGLQNFQHLAISRLAAQHDEITRLRAAATTTAGIRPIGTAPSARTRPARPS